MTAPHPSAHPFDAADRPPRRTDDPERVPHGSDLPPDRPSLNPDLGLPPTGDAPRPIDPSRTGAVWVTGTGAFLLLAAAAVFVAVRWAEIPASVKLAAIAAVTGTFLLAGRRLRASLPATAGALFHLGAFLVPVDVAALAVRVELGWAQLLLVEGLVCTVTFTLAARSERSVVLRWAAAASVVLATAGLGATTPAPAPVLLAGVAAIALVLGRTDDAVPWALTAGLSPVAGLALTATGLAPGVLERVGLAGGQPRLVGLVAGTVSAIVLGTVAQRRFDPGLAYLAFACVVSGAFVSGADLDPTAWAGAIAGCALLASLEAAALLARNDRFWSRPADELATLAEVLAVPGSAIAAGALLLSPIVVLQSTRGAAAAGLLTATWVMADLRRRAGRGTPVSLALLLGGRFPPTTIGIAACLPAAIMLATGSGPVAAVSLVATAAVLLVGGRPLAAGVAVLATTLAPLATLGSRDDALFSSGPVPDTTTLQLVCAAATGIAGSLLLARAARWRTNLDDDLRRPYQPTTWALAAMAPVPLAVASVVARAETGAGGIVLVLTVGLAWLVALAADPAHRSAASPFSGQQRGGNRPFLRRERSLWPATATRLVATTLVLGACGGVGNIEALVVAALVTALVVIDAVRLDEPTLSLGLLAALPALTAAAGEAAGLTTPRTGVGMTLAAVVVAGLASLLPGRWRLPLGAAAGTVAALGLVLATGEAAALADALLVVGGTVVAGGIATRRSDVAVAGGAAMTLGAWSRLVDADVSVSEPYLVPVAGLLLLAGWRSRTAASSWVTTGPAVALLGGAALVERLAGGGGGHALVAGAVGVAAVAAGGAGRLAAPLLLGTALLVALAAHESLGVTAGVPTWAWLALGGSTLLGAGVALERAQLGPLESGRRLVDVVQQRFR